MRLYETTFITDSQLPEDEIEAEIRKVESLITASGGEIVETQRWGVRRLAYEIQKRKQGYYAHFLYKGTPDTPAKIESAFGVNERIMRFLTVVSEVNLEERARRLAEDAPAVIVVPDSDEVRLPSEAIDPLDPTRVPDLENEE